MSTSSRNDPPVLLVAGSLRREAHTTRLLEHAGALVAPPRRTQRVDLVRALPYYDADLDGLNPPEAVNDARTLVARSAGLIIATPEYNATIPGGLKNTIDWLSRPPREHALVGKPIAIIGASPGPSGASRAAAWLGEILPRLGAIVVADPVTVPDVTSHIDAQGRLDDEVDEQLRKLVDALERVIAS